LLQLIRGLQLEKSTILLVIIPHNNINVFLIVEKNIEPKKLEMERLIIGEKRFLHIMPE